MMYDTNSRSLFKEEKDNTLRWASRQEILLEHTCMGAKEKHFLRWEGTQTCVRFSQESYKHLFGGAKEKRETRLMDLVVKNTFLVRRPDYSSSVFFLCCVGPLMSPSLSSRTKADSHVVDVASFSALDVVETKKSLSWSSLSPPEVV
jgi:hypothetical protein